jgi:hypothetical protein
MIEYYYYLSFQHLSLQVSRKIDIFAQRMFVSAERKTSWIVTSDASRRQCAHTYKSISKKLSASFYMHTADSNIYIVGTLQVLKFADLLK